MFGKIAVCCDDSLNPIHYLLFADWHCQPRGTRFAEDTGC